MKNQTHGFKDDLAKIELVTDPTMHLHQGTRHMRSTPQHQGIVLVRRS